MAHDHAASERDRQEAERVGHLTDIEKLQRENVVAIGALREIMAQGAGLVEQSRIRSTAKAAIQTIEALRARR